jgi:hypothetical protein
MELDELKSAWAQYDRKLTENLRLNEQLLRKINTHQSRLELQKPLTYEATGAVMQVVLEVMLVIWSLRVEESRIAIPGLIAAFIGLFYLAFAVVKTNAFFGIDYYGNTVIGLQKQVAGVNKLVLRLRKFEMLLAIPFLSAALPLILKVMHGTDVYTNPLNFWVAVALIVLFCTPLTLWVNRFLYDKKFENAEKLLGEISDFEKEK